MSAPYSAKRCHSEPVTVSLEWESVPPPCDISVKSQQNAAVFVRYAKNEFFVPKTIADEKIW